MPKRLHDSDIWKKSWFRKLNPEEKLAFFYILENCDYVGVWDPDFDAAEFLIGSKVDWDGLVAKVNKNVVILPNKKWFLIDYCNFQYGELRTDKDNKLHRNVINGLKKYGLWDKENECININPHRKSKKIIKKSPQEHTLGPKKEKVYPGPTLGTEYKEKEKKKEKDKEKEKEARAGPRVENKLPISEKAQQLLEFYKKLIGKSKIQRIPAEVLDRLKENHTVEEGKKVILYKFLQWWDDQKTKEWVNLLTLFKPFHFEEYLSQAEQGLDQLLQQSYLNFKQQFIENHIDEPLEIRKKLKLPNFEEYKKQFIKGVELDGEQGSRAGPT